MRRFVVTAVADDAPVKLIYKQSSGLPKTTFNSIVGKHPTPIVRHERPGHLGLWPDNGICYRIGRYVSILHSPNPEWRHQDLEAREAHLTLKFHCDSCLAIDEVSKRYHLFDLSDRHHYHHFLAYHIQQEQGSHFLFDLAEARAAGWNHQTIQRHRPPRHCYYDPKQGKRHQSWHPSRIVFLFHH